MSFILFILLSVSRANTPDWSSRAPVPPEGRTNPYNLSAAELEADTRSGRLHALNYPISVTGIVLPYAPIERFLKADSNDPLRYLLQSMASLFTHFHSFDDVERWLGLHSYPRIEGVGVYNVPFLNGTRPIHRMGFTLLQPGDTRGFTISCAECHSENLFGQRVLGLTNRFPRANRFFYEGLKAASYVSTDFFTWATEATPVEGEMYRKFKTNGEFIGAKVPTQLGLDTSLAQVALSLARRARDAWATPVPGATPRDEPLSQRVADSKPAVWWNLKYKNRWLSDGSVISGNPIFTNFIWNEIGRGTNLRDLNRWLDRNGQVVRELTTAVFASEAPKYSDFFGAVDSESAARGRVHFLKYCARCHGTYENGSVQYFSQTPVIDVGTDPGRYLGMRSLAALNDLQISKANGIQVAPQKGYVPPPLVGIWARWPYFHNNSVPTLCGVLTRSERRAKSYWARPADHPTRDFDRNCNGYPRGRPAEDTPDEFFYQVGSEGLSNAGHDEGVFLSRGQELMSNAEKMDLIRYLQTL